MNKSVKEMKELIALLNESTANDQEGGNEMTNNARVKLTGVDNDGDKYYFKEKGMTIKELRAKKKEEGIEMTYKEFAQLDKDNMIEVLSSFQDVELDNREREVDNRPVPLLVKKQTHSMEFMETYEPEVSEEWELQQMRSRAEAEEAAGTGYKKGEEK